MAGSDGRSSIWAFLLYPESMPPYEQVMAFFEATLLPIYVSPLHDRDRYTYEDVVDAREKDPDCKLLVGEQKKPHYHCMVRFGSDKSPEQVLRLLRPIGVTFCLRLGNLENSDKELKARSWRGYARYLIHADNPEKAQYSKDDVRSFHAPEYKLAAALNLSAERLLRLEPVFEFIKSNGVVSYAWLVDYCLANAEDWAGLVMQNRGVIREYLQSYYWTNFKAPSSSLGIQPFVAGGVTTTLPQQKESQSNEPKLLVSH